MPFRGSFLRWRCRRCGSRGLTGLGHRHQADQFLADSRLLQPDQSLDADIEIRSRGPDQLQDELFVESGFGQSNDILIGQRLVGQRGGSKLLRGGGDDGKKKGAQNAHTLVISVAWGGMRGRISPMPAAIGRLLAKLGRIHVVTLGMTRISALIVVMSLALRAQEASRKVQFEEASIKPDDPNSSGGTTNSSPGRFSATNVTLKRLIGRAYDLEPYQVEGGPKWIETEKFTSILSSVTERPVKDMTGLKAVYKLKLEWMPESAGTEPKPEQSSAAPSIFTALQEQLGLKLETTKAPVEMLIIDRAEKPVEN